ncbi:hypothetical protein QN379_12310 [Glaciimonas sp. Gout2]|nr:hypothetical protein [Glaciimonas sp. Gout2]
MSRALMAAESILAILRQISSIIDDPASVSTAPRPLKQLYSQFFSFDLTPGFARAVPRPA